MSGQSSLRVVRHRTHSKSWLNNGWLELHQDWAFSPKGRENQARIAINWILKHRILLLTFPYNLKICILREAVLTAKMHSLCNILGVTHLVKSHSKDCSLSLVCQLILGTKNMRSNSNVSLDIYIHQNFHKIKVSFLTERISYFTDCTIRFQCSLVLQIAKVPFFSDFSLLGEIPWQNAKALKKFNFQTGGPSHFETSSVIPSHCKKPPTIMPKHSNSPYCRLFPWQIPQLLFRPQSHPPRRCHPPLYFLHLYWACNQGNKIDTFTLKTFSTTAVQDVSCRFRSQLYFYFILINIFVLLHSPKIRLNFSKKAWINSNRI